MIRFSTKLALVSALALVAATAEAAPTLRGEVTVTSKVVTVADMFDDAGAHAETAIFSAPAPGTTGTVELSAIRSAAARIGLGDFHINGLNAVRVTRAGATVDESMLKNLIRDNLSERGLLGSDVVSNIQFSRFFDSIQVATNGAAVRLDNLRYVQGGRDFAARFVLGDGARPIEVSGTIDMTVEVPHLASTLPAGTILMPEHITMRAVPAGQASVYGVLAPEQLIGMALNRQSREGLMLRASDISAPLAVSKNELVTIMYRRGPMTLTVKGQAITGASRGNNLQVLNLMSKRVVTAVAVAPGTVEVNGAPLAVAGL